MPDTNPPKAMTQPDTGKPGNIWTKEDGKDRLIDVQNLSRGASDIASMFQFYQRIADLTVPNAFVHGSPGIWATIATDGTTVSRRTLQAAMNVQATDLPNTLDLSNINLLAGNPMTLNLDISWHGRRFSSWLRGRILTLEVGYELPRTLTEADNDKLLVVEAKKSIAIKSIYKHMDTGQVRVYTHNRGWPLDGAEIVINGQAARVLERVGRFGRLHLTKN